MCSHGRVCEPPDESGRGTWSLCDWTKACRQLSLSRARFQVRPRSFIRARRRGRLTTGCGRRGDSPSPVEIVLPEQARGDGAEGAPGFGERVQLGGRGARGQPLDLARGELEREVARGPRVGAA